MPHLVVKSFKVSFLGINALGLNELEGAFSSLDKMKKRFMVGQIHRCFTFVRICVVTMVTTVV